VSANGPRNPMMRRLAVLALPLVVSLGGCEDWFTDFKQQPSVGTWQQYAADSAGGETTPFRGNPQGSVPTTGMTVAAWQVSYTPGIAQLDSMAGLGNPVAADARSLENGRKYYQVNCAVCHGVAGDVQTPLRQVNPVMGAVVPPLASGNALTLSDGYLWAIMRNGRGLMASYNRIPEMDRWDVVNYIRGLQGRHPVEKAAVGFPGQTGDALPGASLLGPTMPAAYRKPSTAGMVPKAERPAGAAPGGGH
jgi:mono/diheme cytochrome c family protein